MKKRKRNSIKRRLESKLKAMLLKFVNKKESWWQYCVLSWVRLCILGQMWQNKVVDQQIFVCCCIFHIVAMVLWDCLFFDKPGSLLLCWHEVTCLLKIMRTEHSSVMSEPIFVGCLPKITDTPIPPAATYSYSKSLSKVRHLISHRYCFNRMHSLTNEHYIYP